MPTKKVKFEENEIAVFEDAVIYKRGEYWQFRLWLAKERKYARFSLKTRNQNTALEKAKLHYHELMSNQLSGKRYFSLTTKDGVAAYIAERQKDVDAGISDILDESITGLAIRKEGPAALDLSKINFQALSEKFKESKHKNTDLESLKAAIHAKLEKLIQVNKTRADFSEKFEELIESYNTGSRTIEEIFAELLNFTNTLNAEEERHVRENMSEEELVIFDILTRPAPNLTDSEKAEVKKVSRELLAKLKNLLVLNWRQKEAARSQLKIAIQNALDDGLPEAYTKDLYQDKCSAMFEHIYEAYPEAERLSI
ncbi:DUF3387 domain-containing protein [Polynucleobacter paneuropaeus]|nr:DUF3387 domain-containing protein [Polynucleobacter paneuropaeus]